MSEYTEEELERFRELDGVIVKSGRPHAKMVRNAKAARANDLKD